jgi:hypothetical protein
MDKKESLQGDDIKNRSIRGIIFSVILGFIFLLVGFAVLQIVQPGPKYHSSIIIEGNRQNEALENNNGFGFDTDYLQSASYKHAKSVSALISSKSSAKELLGNLDTCDAQFPIFTELREYSKVINLEIRCNFDDSEDIQDINTKITDFLDSNYFNSLDSSEVEWGYKLMPFEKVQRSIPQNLILIFFTLSGMLGGFFVGFFIKNIV